jgi:hypothetical protein
MDMHDPKAKSKPTKTQTEVKEERSGVLPTELTAYNFVKLCVAYFPTVQASILIDGCTIPSLFSDSKRER